MYFTDEAIDSGTCIRFDFEEWLEEAEVHELVLPLEVLTVIPFNNWIFKFTHSVGVTEYLEDPIFDGSLLAVVGVGEYIIFGGHRQLRREPLNGIEVDHPLHVEEINGNFYGVSLAYLVDWLDVWTIDQLGDLVLVLFEWIGVLL